MKVPENAREQLRATLKSMDMQPDKHWVDVPRWAVPLVLAHLDLQQAASEAVTTQVVDRAITGYDQRVATERCGSFAEAMEAAINAVAPALLLAGERRGLERAAEIFDRRAGVNAGEAEWSHPDGRHYRGFPNYPAKPLNHAATRYLEAARDAALLRALGRPA